jgi:hypothetical protein
MHDFKTAKRRIWHGKNGLVNGYITQSTNLTNVVLTNAGHMSPGFYPDLAPKFVANIRDAPEATLTMMENFIFGRAFNTSK